VADATGDSAGAGASCAATGIATTQSAHATTRHTDRKPDTMAETGPFIEKSCIDAFFTPSLASARRHVDP
jgi:hypothetical protein